MYIKEVILEGFKSYAHRTHIKDFDRHFNAITGLNGSGKSNILDGICFVLGISNSNLRAENLQDLVFKKGQAGIVHAQVSIVFDLTDSRPEHRPAGHEDAQSITISRNIILSAKKGNETYYMLNGKRAQTNTVHDLLLSVGLNINNPTFLIQQGRITQVVNMKPKEILGMLEETAGTKMFEIKRQQSEKLMARKNEKLNQVQEIIDKDITPRLTELKEQCDECEAFEKLQAQTAYMQKLVVAYDYHCQRHAQLQHDAQLQQMRGDKRKLEQQVESYKLQIQSLRAQIGALERKIGEDKGDSGPVRQLQRQLDDAKQRQNGCESALKKAENALKDAKKELEKKTRQLQETGDLIGRKRRRIAEQNPEQQQAETAKLQQQLDNLKKQLESVSAGIAASETDGKTLSESLSDCQKKSRDAETQAKKLHMVLQQKQQQLQQEELKLRTADTDAQAKQKQIESIQAQVQQLEQQLQAMLYSQQLQQHEQLLQAIRDARAKLDAAQQDMQRVRRDIPYYYFPQIDYARHGIDRGKVKGIVADHVDLTDDKWAVAVETAAGGRLTNFITDDDETAAMLTKEGVTSHRVTVLVLNKLQTQPMHSRAVDKARQYGAVPAIARIQHPQQLQQAMTYVFGHVLVCEGDLKQAELAAFDPDIRKRTVTLDGNVFEPRGVLTGGSRPQQQANTLKLLTELHKKKREFDQLNRQLVEQLEPKAAAFDAQKAQYSAKAHDLDVMKHQLQCLVGELARSKHGRAKERCETLRRELAEDDKKRAECLQTHREMEQRCRQIEDEIRRFEQHFDKEKMCNEIRAKIRNVEQQVATSKTKTDEIVNATQELEEEIKLDEQELARQADEQAQVASQIAGAEQQVADARRKLQEAQAHTEKREEDLLAEQARQKSEYAALERFKTELQQLQNEERDGKDALDKFDECMAGAQQALEALNHAQEKLRRQHEFIAQDQDKFGRPDTEYDFEGRHGGSTGMANLKLQLQQLDADVDTRRKKINLRAVTMYQKSNKEYLELVEKKQKIDEDRKKIEHTITSLQQQKRSAVDTVWRQASDNMGKIFRTLLPKVDARIEAPANSVDFMESGLELQVGFGERDSIVWKESLAELSGGQKSLLALSFVLALLRIRSVPMYILDEVDSALDPSHTQNIGIMLRQQFSESQFIIVSLKDGLFNNANVLFRTRLEQGGNSAISTTRRQPVARR